MAVKGQIPIQGATGRQFLAVCTVLYRHKGTLSHLDCSTTGIVTEISGIQYCIQRPPNSGTLKFVPPANLTGFHIEGGVSAAQCLWAQIFENSSGFLNHKNQKI